MIGLFGQVRALVVAGHQDRAAADDFAHFAHRHFLPLLVHDLHLEKGRAAAHGGELAGEIGLVEDGHEPFGQAVEFVEAAGQAPVQFFLVLFMQGGSQGEQALEGAAGLQAEVRAS